jgi:very-short-patch-repair endonuclease
MSPNTCYPCIKSIHKFRRGRGRTIWIVLGLTIGAIIEAGNWVMPGIHRFDKTRQRARELRQQMTPAEVILWDRLRGRRLGGFKFRRQHPIGPYIADFYCATRRLVIEVDGNIHLGQAEADEQRSRRLAEYGYRVLRVSNQEIESDLESVICHILEACHAGSDSPLPGCIDLIHG